MAEDEEDLSNLSEEDDEENDPEALRAAIEHIDACIDWWLTPPDERGEISGIPGFEEVGENAISRVSVMFLRNHARVPQFWALMDHIMRGAWSRYHGFYVKQVVPLDDFPICARVTFQATPQYTEPRIRVTLDDVAVGLIVPLDVMLQREAQIIREQQEEKMNVERIAAVSMGLHPRAGRDSSLRRAYNHQLAAKDPLLLTLELSGHKPVSEWRGWGNSSASSSNNNYSEVKSRAPSNGFVPQTYANSRGVRLVGDLPIFVAHQSADVWARPDLYFLDDRHHR